MSEVAIRVDGLGKRYRLGQLEPFKTLRTKLTKAIRSTSRGSNPLTSGQSEPETDHIWALKDVSFEVQQGEVIGVIGANGAGKTTLLRLLSRITDPTEGRAVIHGRVGSLLEVGTGFHPELTGRENTYLNGAILGMKKSEIDRKFDDIVDFAGVNTFIDTPVKRYSSGMQVRLAFAVAAHLETEILLVDEVLAVGDAVFQLQSINKMSEVARGGRTILFVSHNMETISRLCQRCVLLEQGRVRHVGTVSECIDLYLAAARQMRAGNSKGISLKDHPGRKDQQGPVQLTSFALIGEDGLPTLRVPCGGAFTARIGYVLTESSGPQRANFNVIFSNLYNQRIATCLSGDTHLEPMVIDGPGEVVCRIPRLQLRPGDYTLHVSVSVESGHSDTVYDAALMEVWGSDFYPSRHVPPRTMGEVLFEHEWEMANSAKEPDELTSGQPP